MALFRLWQGFASRRLDGGDFRNDFDLDRGVKGITSHLAKFLDRLAVA